MADCVFCRVIDGTEPASLVHEDDLVVALLDLRPLTDGHTLVVPRRHASALVDLDDPEADRIMAVARRVAAALRASSLRCDGVNLFYADGDAAGQEVFHAHMHVLARYPGDGFRIQANWDRGVTRAELDRHAEAIRATQA